MKIQPIDCSAFEQSSRADSAKPAVKSRLKRLFERQFPSVLRNSAADRLTAEQYGVREGGELEPSSIALAKMVQNFMEESSEKQADAKCGRNRCNCFNGNGSDSSEDELGFYNGSHSGSSDALVAAPSGDACEILKSLALCTTVTERNLLADVANVVERNKSIYKSKAECRGIVATGLSALGYNASICKSRWEKFLSFPAGEHEYIDVVMEGERLLIDIDFRSEFEIARPSSNYKAVFQLLPSIFVGKPDRLQQIVAVVCEAAKQSLKKKGLHFPPWRKPEYMRAKWLSPHERLKATQVAVAAPPAAESSSSSESPCQITTRNFSAEFELIFRDPDSLVSKSTGGGSSDSDDREEKTTVVVSSWKPPAVKPKVTPNGGKVVTGLASVLKEKP